MVVVVMMVVPSRRRRQQGDQAENKGTHYFINKSILRIDNTQE